MASSTRDRYLESLARLNPEQLAAVQEIAGPVMVIAGAGTGKTQVLTLRIAEILNQTDTAPANILALTFTEVAARTMRLRLRQLIGPTADQIQIDTFNGLGSSIIQEFPEYFATNRDLKLITSFQAHQIVCRILEQPLFIGLKTGAILEESAAALLNELETCRSENVTADRLLEAYEKYIQEDIPREFARKKSPTPNQSNLTKEGEKQIERFNRYKLIAQALTEYEQALTEQGLYTFSDQINRVVELMQRDESFKQLIQERYHYILVDEYQDTNGLQLELVRLLTDYEQPNIFVVGDDKQAIYRFQGASVANLARFKEHYQSVTLISLRQNYRSIQPILDFAEQIIEQSDEKLADWIPELGATIKLESQVTDDESSDRAVELTSYHDSQLELAAICQAIVQQFDEGRAQSAAILVRSNSEILPYLERLRQLGIATETGRELAFSQTGIYRLLNIAIAALKDPNQLDSLFLAWQVFPDGPSANDLLNLASYLNRQKLWKEPAEATLKTVLDQNLVNFEAGERFYQSLERWRELHQSQPKFSLVQNLENLIKAIGLYRFALTHQSSDFELAALRAIFDLATSYQETAEHRHHRLWELWEHLGYLEKIKQPLTLDLYQSSQANQPIVCISTIHSAKGREFDLVYMPNLVETTKSKKGNRLPPHLIERHSTDHRLADELRLYYVAATRAKKRLYLSYPETRLSNEKRTASVRANWLTAIYPETNESDTMLETPDLPSNLDLDQRLANQLTPHRYSHSKPELIRELLADLKLSATSLNNYLSCPQNFFYQSLLTIPASKSEYQIFGDLVHGVIAEYMSLLDQVEINGRPSRLSDLTAEAMISYFDRLLVEKEIVDYQSQVYRRQFTEVLDKCLPNSFGRQGKTLKLESKFASNLGLTTDQGRIGLSGRIDRLEEIAPNHWRIIDYKTGEVPTDLTRDSKGRDQARQLQFYALLASLDPQFKGKHLSFALIQCSSSQGYKFVELPSIDQTTIEELKELIRQVVAAMYRLEFHHLDPTDPDSRQLDRHYFCQLNQDLANYWPLLETVQIND
ncbi:MAG: DNA helicase II / ATP-dependent DNA helicase PcrA [Candidatus Berkelbacteria bacterium Gr01-1014_85]|uniref:DNA 3'-5' helicase n=1 Tax=Candidatus Berkelbacteria bacterium Gr01-1014_85 TaxID=2017150 RepID=A0A554JBM9_9BACT|nr:MAG: DNA helicase II / ATP-dependent DNA helicase PcrA [Candidatus Berkelbacteria bacterium Gr01-1014_85]